jgi:prepilin-type N-terminal cleavage/methylation domain-containing protein
MTAPNPRVERGFTLIEVMLVVAIIGLLSSIAIPQFLDMQIRAKRSEVIVNVDGILLAEAVYYHLYMSGVVCEESPGTDLGREKKPWDPTMDGWEELGWAPDGKVYCHYEVAEYTALPEWGRVIGRCDIDGDEIEAVWWGDFDPERAGSSTQHLVVRPSPTTEWQGVY